MWGRVPEGVALNWVCQMCRENGLGQAMGLRFRGRLPVPRPARSPPIPALKEGARSYPAYSIWFHTTCQTPPTRPHPLWQSPADPAHRPAPR